MVSVTDEQPHDPVCHWLHHMAWSVGTLQSSGLLQLGRSTEMPHFWQYMTVHGLFQSAINAGELPQGLDTEYLADALLAPLKVDIFRFQREVRGFTLERISEGLRVLIAGLRYCVD